MSVLDIQVACPVYDSFRVQQVGGMFDVPLQERVAQSFRVDVPQWVLTPDAEVAQSGNRQLQESTRANTPADSRSPQWQIGLIVGPSGSGKTTVAQRIFGDRLYRRQEWPADRAVVDGLGSRPIKEIVGLFTAVGFSSPPSWIKPYRVLSNGEQFRCDLARALAGYRHDHSDDKAVDSLASTSNVPREGQPLVAFDEFTSVVDRNVARAASAAIAKGIRSDRIRCRFVAVTCHYDVQPWLEPDWVIDMATATFSRRRLRRPPIELQIFRCGRGAWPLFAHHHYLSGELPRYTRCFLAIWDGDPVAFCATVSLIGQKNHWRISRIVTLPDYQGLGIGMAVAEAVAELHVHDGNRMNVTASHPALIAHCRRSPKWRTVGVKKCGSLHSRQFIKNYRGSVGRAVVSFEYVATQKQIAATAASATIQAESA